MSEQSKKLLMTAYDFPPNWGGVASYSWELAHEFHKLGYSVTVITKKRESSLDTPFKIIEVKLPKIGLLAAPILFGYLVNHLRKTHYDLFFSTLWLPGGIALSNAKKSLKIDIPHCVAVHAMEIVDSNETLKQRIRQKMKFLKQKLFQDCDLVFSVSQFSKELLLKNVSLDSDKVVVIENGVNLNEFSSAPQKSDTSFPYILSASRLVPNKGIDQLIKSFDSVKTANPNATLNIVGDGPDRSRLAKLAGMQRNAKDIHFHGKVDLPTLKQHYAKADLFCLMSREEKHHVEGFGLVILEAALSKTPSLGGRSGGIPEAIIEGKTGWLVDPHDESAIEATLLAVLADRKKLEKIGQQAFEHTKANRLWSHAVKKMEAAIEKL